MTSVDATVYKTYMCLICGFVYSEAAGLPEEGIAPGTRWEDVPMNWTCPNAAHAKKTSRWSRYDAQVNGG